MCEELIKKSEEFAECVASEINKLSKCNCNFQVKIKTHNDDESKKPACFYPNSGIVSIHRDYFDKKNQEELDFVLKSTMAHEILHLYLDSKNIDLYEVLDGHNKFEQIYSTMIDKFTLVILGNFIHHLFIPKLIDILGCDNGIFFNEIKKDYEQYNDLQNSIALSLDFWFNDKMKNKSRDDYISEKKEYIDVCIFNKCYDFLEKFPFDDIDFSCDFGDKKFFEPLAILFDDIYQYAKNV